MRHSFSNIPYQQVAGTSFHHNVLLICMVFLILVGSDLLSVVLYRNNLANRIEILTLLPILATVALYYRHLLRGAFASPEIALMIIIAILSASWSDYRLLTMERTVPLAATTLFGLTLGSMMSMRGLALFVALYFALSMALSLAAIGALPQARGLPPWENSWNGIYLHKNELGANSVMAILSSFFAMKITTGRLRMFFQITAGVAVVLLIASDSRTAQIIGLFVISGFLITKIMPRLEFLWALGFILFSAFVIGMGTLILASDIAEPLFAMIGRQPTLSNRIPIWELTWPYAMDRFWLGYGYAGYWHDAAPHMRIYENQYQLGFTPYYSHNGLIETWLNIGFVGVVLLFLAFFRFFSSVFYCMRHLKPRDDFVLVFALSVGFIFLNITESNVMGRLDGMWILLVMYMTKTNLVAKALVADFRLRSASLA
ncbi:O-antigen ligase [Ruegeria sp. HKCCA5491]|uniref:O-antigen ligase family protein n=1 Tax=Ruegeria sp. HKCCA5491 TaxID=2682986 RepID=UPI001487F923|nr:O-antigen ligase family protein [Ruegeria sp. HKCCA5491]